MYEWGRFFIYDLSNAKYAWHISFKPSSPNFKWLHWFLSTSHINVMHLTVEVNQKSWISITFQIYIYLWPKLRCEMRTFSPIYNMQKDVEWKPQPKFQKLHWKFTGRNMKSSTPGGQNSILQSCRIGFVNCERLCAVLGFRHILCLYAHGFALPKSEIRIEKSEIASNEMAISFMDIPLWLGNVLWNSSKSEIKAMPKNFVQFVSSELEVSEWVSEWLSVCVCVGWLALSSIWCCALP